VSNEGTGEVDNDTERTIQEDAWIAVEDEENRLVRDRKDRAVHVDGESRTALDRRDSMMLSQAERAKLGSKVIRPQSCTPARKAREVSGMSSKEEGIPTASELLVDSNKAIVIADDDPAESQPSSSRGRQPKKRQKRTTSQPSSISSSTSLPSNNQLEDRLTTQLAMLVEAVTRSIALALVPERQEMELAEAIEQRLQAVVDEKLEGLKESQLALMTIMQKVLSERKEGG